MRISSFRAAAAGAFVVAATLVPASAVAEPRADGETIRFQNYAGSPSNMFAIVAQAKGFCTKYNFKCELVTLNSTPIGLQSLVGNAIDVAHIGTEAIVPAVLAGADIVLVGAVFYYSVVSVAVRSDDPVATSTDGYPAFLKTLKGRRVGVSSRGTSTEKYFEFMLRDAGMQPSDVTFVAVGTPSDAYTALTVSKQIDAAINVQPMNQLCELNKTCKVVVNYSKGEGAKEVLAINGASVTNVMRRSMAEGQPKLMAAYYAAMKDAAAWIQDPRNLDEIVQIYKPLISFGAMPGADELRANWLKDFIKVLTPDYALKVSAVQAAIDFSYEAKLIDRKVDATKIIAKDAPQKP